MPQKVEGGTATVEIPSEALLLALFKSVQRLLGHGPSCYALPWGGLHAVHHRVVLHRQKLSKGEGGSPVNALQPWHCLAVPD